MREMTWSRKLSAARHHQAFSLYTDSGEGVGSMPFFTQSRCKLPLTPLSGTEHSKTISFVTRHSQEQLSTLQLAEKNMNKVQCMI